MEIKEAKAAIEAILFASGDPIDIEKISSSLELDKRTTNKLLNEIKDKFDSIDSGICIIKLSNKYQMCSKSKYSKYVRNILDLHRHTPLTQAAMEVLAIIAYNQPVTKAFIEQVRGVDCSRIISNLSVKDLIEERGRLELPGKPLLYGTTLNFLKCFGISSIDELPPIDNLNKE